MDYFLSFIDSLCEYMQSIMAGLAGTPHLVAATILALTRLVYEFKGKTIKINVTFFQFKQYAHDIEFAKFMFYYLILKLQALRNVVKPEDEEVYIVIINNCIYIYYNYHCFNRAGISRTSEAYFGEQLSVVEI